MRSFRLALITLLLSFFSAIAAASPSFLDERASQWALKAYEKRSGVEALPYLSTLNVLWDGADSAHFLPRLDMIMRAPDSHPMVAARARNLKRYYLALKADWEGAGRLVSEDSFLTDWLVMAPFANDNKGGFEAVYPPESSPDFAVKCLGLDREVSWRPLPRPPCTGSVLLDSYVDPGENVTAYMASFVYSVAPRNCVLRCSLTGASKIWVNGELVASCPDYNSASFDQYSYPARLSAGWNLVLLKTCREKGNWSARVRVTDPKGSPLKGLEQTSSFSRVGESLSAMLAKNGAAPPSMSYCDPLSELKSRSENGGWQEAFELGLYLLGAKPFDMNEDDDLEALTAASSMEGAPAYIRYFMGEAEPDFNRMREHYEAASSGGEFSLEALAQLFNYYENRSMHLRAMEYIGRALKMRPGDPVLQSSRLALLATSDLLEAHGRRELEKLRSAHPDSLQVVRNLSWLTERDGSFQEREKLLLEMARLQYDDYPVQKLFNLYAEAGRRNDAVKALRDFLAMHPYDRSFLMQLSRYLLNTGDPSACAGTLGAFLENAPDWADARELMGEALLASGEREKALEQFEQALILEPQNDNLKRRLSFLKPDEEMFYATFRVPGPELPAPSDEHLDKAVQILADNTYVLVENSGLSTRYVQLVARVQSSFGAEIMSGFPITYDPDWQEVRVLEASAERDGGVKIRAGSYTTSSLSDPQYQLYYRSRQLVLTFSGLKKGDTVSIEYILSDKSEAGEYGRYFGDMVPFGSEYPVLLKKYTLKTPDSLPITYRGVRTGVEPSIVKAGGTATYQWVKRDIPPDKSEPYSPGFGETASYLHVSTFNSWEELGRWYSSFIKDQWEMGAAARDLVKAITEGKSSPEDKVKAVHQWVARQTRYVGLEFGVHGYKPYKVSQVFDRRFGDCKDKAILLAAMLKEAGVDAEMVLIRTRNLGAIEKEPASLATFNHAICYVPELDLYIDGTAEFSGLREVPYLDQGTEVLTVGREGKVSVRRVPQSGPGDNVFSARYRFSPVKGDDGARTNAFFRITGAEAAGVRSDLQNEEKQRETLEKQLSRNYPASVIETAEFKGIDDINSDIEVSFQGTLRGVLKPQGSSSSSAVVWMGRSQLTSGYAALTLREQPLVIPYPTTQVYDITYELPPGARAAPPAEKDVSSPFGSFKRTVEAGEGSVRVRSELVFSASRVEPERYSEFKHFMAELDKLTSERMTIKW